MHSPVSAVSIDGGDDDESDDSFYTTRTFSEKEDSDDGSFSSIINDPNVELNNAIEIELNNAIENRKIQNVVVHLSNKNKWVIKTRIWYLKQRQKVNQIYC